MHHLSVLVISLKSELLKSFSLKLYTLVNITYFHAPSRPFRDLKLINTTKKLELMGLTQDRVIKFVKQNVSKDRIEEVRQALQNNPILMSVSSITFYCAALCKVLGRDDVTTKDLRTYTQITAYIMEVLWPSVINPFQKAQHKVNHM